MKKYVKPDMELIKFSVDDVILASKLSTTTTEPTSAPEWSGYYPPRPKP